MNKINNPQGYGFWKGHIEGYEESGLSQEAYCAQAGISLNRFRYQYMRSQGKQKSHDFHFIEAKVHPERERELHSGLKISLPNGVVIGFEGAITEAMLALILNKAGLPC